MQQLLFIIAYDIFKNSENLSFKSWVELLFNLQVLVDEDEDMKLKTS